MEKKYLKVIRVPNSRLLLQEVKELDIQKSDIINIILENKEYVLFYYG